MVDPFTRKERSERMALIRAAKQAGHNGVISVVNIERADPVSAASCSHGRRRIWTGRHSRRNENRTLPREVPASTCLVPKINSCAQGVKVALSAKRSTGESLDDSGQVIPASASVR